MKLEDWLNVWLNMYHKYNIKLRTYNRYSEIIEKHINPELGGYDINDLKPEVLQKFIDDLSDISIPEKKPLLEGKNMFIILAKKADK